MTSTLVKRRNMYENNSNDSAMDIIAQVIKEKKAELGESFSFDSINLAELERRTGISRQKLRTLKKNQFKNLPHGNSGKTSVSSVLDGYRTQIDELLKKGVSNSTVCYETLQLQGYPGSLSTVKRYIQKHKYLIPARRRLVEPQGSRGIRYSTGPGEAYQMDWGFAKVTSGVNAEYTVACFAMICHHCGTRYIEFFPDAKQENLFIGMLHAFAYMGVPSFVLTDNMKSVVIKRDMDGHPVWQADYEAFMNTVGFRTRLCKPRHPFTKGKVERLVGFVKQNFLNGRVFGTITDLNMEALSWCNRQNEGYQIALDGIPASIHNQSCALVVKVLEESPALLPYLCPQRKVSFDGFVNYEGRRFGIPYRYQGRTVRIRRNGFYIYIYSDDFKELLTTHEVTWSRKDSFCKDQYITEQPEELPTAPIRVCIEEKPTVSNEAFNKFDFDREDLK